MKKKIYSLVFALCILIGFSAYAQQDTLIAFTFPAQSADSLPDVFIPTNANRFLSCEYGTWGQPTFVNIPIDYTLEGYEGGTDKCASVTGVDNGADSVTWMIKFRSPNYHNLKLYSKQKSGANGPRDFKVQYKMPGSSSPWIDLAGGTVVCSDNWNGGVIDGIDLPAECNDMTSNVSIRWIMTSNTDINGNTVLPSGITMIDDIVITGEVITSVDHVSINNVNVYPNPSNGSFVIENMGNATALRIMDVLGKNVYNNENLSESRLIIENMPKGLYFVQLTTNNEVISIVKVIVK